MTHALLRNEPSDHGQPPADAVLRPLLEALDWIGDSRQLSDALPEGRVVTDFASLVTVLDRLDYRIVEIESGQSAPDVDMLPALLLRPDDDIWLVVRAEGDRVEVFKGQAAAYEHVEPDTLAGRLFAVRAAETDAPEGEQGRFGWISGLLERERRLVRLLFLVTFIINAFALSLPLYLLSVFDLAIGARSSTTLITLASGIAVILCAEVALREIRARAIARFSVRTQIHVMASVFEKLMRLPISFIESASVAGQLNRLRTFESIRDIFSGPLATSLLDLPFILVFVIAIFAVGGSLGWLVVGFIVLLGLLSAFFIPRARARTDRAGVARSDARLFRMDLTRHLGTIRDSGAEDIWSQRYRDMVARQLNASQASQQVSFAEQTLAQALASITGALVVGLGALKVMEGTLSVGALAAVMAIVWRVLAPIQTALLNMNRLFQAIDVVKQINQLMKLPTESEGRARQSYHDLRGDIALENVGYRTNAQSLPILRGIDMQIKAGELIVLTGAPGPSRSALLKLIASLHQPSVGRIRLDGADMRQFDQRELHRSIGYVNDQQVIFSGTLADNLLLANPMADEDQIYEAIAEADLRDFVDRLENGIHTDLTEIMQAGLSTVVSQKIRLARIYLQAPPIYLFDEPVRELDPSGRQAFIRKLQSLKGNATVVIRASDPQILNLADGVAYLHGGQLVSGRSTLGSGARPELRQQQQKRLPKSSVSA